MPTALMWIILMIASAASLPTVVLAGKLEGEARKAAAIDLITHSSIAIDRPPEVVWPLVVNSNVWTQLNLLHRGGRVGQVGEYFNVVDPARLDTVLGFAENVEMTPKQRRTFKVYGKDGQLGGYVTWALKEAVGRTLVTYDLHYESILSDDERQRTNDTSLAQQRRERRDRAKKKAESELLTLKNLAESKPKNSEE